MKDRWRPRGRVDAHTVDGRSERVAREKYEWDFVAVIIRFDEEDVYRVRKWEDYGNFIGEYPTLVEAKFAAELIFNERNDK